jgi:hypothetical protein
MLVRITNCCRMQCPHCMINAEPDGEHMTTDVFAKALDFTRYFDYPIVQISGGEPVEHPQFFEIMWMAKGSGCSPIILSNGMFLEDNDLTKKVLDLNIPVQITNDSRLYPKKIPCIEHELLFYEHQIQNLMPLGRAAKSKIQMIETGIPWHRAPSCFNLRSLTRSVGTFRNAVLMLRKYQKFCSPSINIDGSVVAGESNLCHKIGHVDSDEQEITDNILDMECNVCDLEDNLSDKEAAALGHEKTIWTPEKELWVPE